MKNVLSNIHISRQAMFYMLAAAVLVLMVLHPQMAFASDTSGDGSVDTSSMPFVAPLQTLKAALTGPFAMAVSLIGIVAAGAVLIFGGDMSGFLRTLVFLVLVIAVIIGGGSIIDMIQKSSGAVIASALGAFEPFARGLIARTVIS
jgi:type IV secretion system protein TrbC